MPKYELSNEELQREQLMFRELKKFHREHAYLGGPLTTSLTKKRVRVPHADADVNPFCMERQVADGFEQFNFNKNPRFFINTIKNSPRIEENPHNHSSFISEATDMMASSGFSPRARAEFKSAIAPAAYHPTGFSAPGVISVDQSGLRAFPMGHPLSPEKHTVHTTSKHAPPTHSHYSVQRSTQAVSFGHRPESASRMYDPLTSTVVRVKRATTVRQLAPVSAAKVNTTRVGMSATQLQELLTPTKPNRQQNESDSGSVPQTKRSPIESSRQEPNHTNAKDEADENRLKAQAELERGYNNETYYPPKTRKVIRFQPPTDQTTAQLINKFRKLAVGKMPE